MLVVGQEKVARTRFCVSGCGEAVLVFLQLLAKEIASVAGKEGPGSGTLPKGLAVVLATFGQTGAWLGGRSRVSGRAGRKTLQERVFVFLAGDRFGVLAAVNFGPKKYSLRSERKGCPGPGLEEAWAGRRVQVGGLGTRSCKNAWEGGGRGSGARLGGYREKASLSGVCEARLKLQLRCSCLVLPQMMIR